MAFDLVALASATTFVLIFLTGAAFLGAAGTFNLDILVVFGDTIRPTSIDPTDFLGTFVLFEPLGNFGLPMLLGVRIIFINRQASSDRWVNMVF